MLAFNHLGRLGRLGNQMFQYAAVRGIAANKGYEWCIPNHDQEVDDGIGNKLRTEIFDCFNLTNLSKRNIFVLDRGYAPIVQEKFFHFDQELFDLCPNEVSLYGFFQSEKWFKNIENQIRDDFSFKDEILSPCLEMIYQVDKPISLHIRRGDFLLNNKNHPPQSIEYYENALAHFDNHRQVLVFSDDPSWCNEQPIFADERFLIAEGNSNYVDLCLMSLCSSHIIANSTFSWWGAWLSGTKDVIAPQNWFGPNLNQNNTKDLYCDGWKII
jgi:Glycosyl transferase family 11